MDQRCPLTPPEASEILLDIYRFSKLLIDRHGDETPIDAAMHADAMLDQGDLDGAAVWRRIIGPSTNCWKSGRATGNRCIEVSGCAPPSQPRLADRLGIRRVVLVPLHVGLHVIGRHDAHHVAESLQLASPVMRCCARLNANQTGRLLPEERQNLAAPQLSADHGLTRDIDTVDLENVLRKIKPDRANPHYS